MVYYTRDNFNIYLKLIIIESLIYRDFVIDPPTLNPEILFIESKLISHEDISFISTNIGKFINIPHIPLIKKIEGKDLGLRGTIDHALEFLYS